MFSAQNALSSPKGVFDLAAPSFPNFTNEDGLPVNSVMTIERDHRGFVWFGTQDGAGVFNGHSFSVLNMPNKEVSNYIFDILVASDKSIWFATSVGGVHRLKEDEWTTYDQTRGMETNETRSLLETKDADGESVIWVGRRSGLSRIEGDKITNFTEKDGLPDRRVRDLIEVEGIDGEMERWIATYGGIAVWGKNSKRSYTQENGLPGKVVYALLNTESENGEVQVWAATDGGLALFEKGNWRTFESVDKRLTTKVRSLHESKDVNGKSIIWIGFDGLGLGFLKNSQWHFYEDKDGLASNLVYAFEDTGASDGSVWFSTVGKGVSKFERGGWRTISTDSGLKNDIVFSVRSIGSHTWFATYGGGVSGYKDGTWKNFSEGNGSLNDFVHAFHVSGSGENEVLWAGVEGGLLKYENDTLKPVRLIEEDKQVEVWGLADSLESKGNILVATSSGLFELDTESEGLPKSIDIKVDDKTMRGALQTRVGQEIVTWGATYNRGLVRIGADKTEVFDRKNGLKTNRVYSVTEVKNGQNRELWAATGGGGIAIFDLENPKNEIRILGSETGLLPSDTAYRVFQGPKGRVFVSTNKGVSLISLAKTGKLEDASAYFFTTKDGLPNNECTSGDIYLDSQGLLWVPTVGGAAVLNLDEQILDDEADKVYLLSAEVDGKARRVSAGDVFDYSENAITFRYVMPTSFRESATQYQTQMIGLEDQPTVWSNDPRREFNFIPSGDYTFKIWGKDASGNISDPLSISFSVSTPWWQTWWAFLLYALTIAAVVALIAYLIYRSKYRRMLEIERVRTRIATDLHDDVGSSLSKISILSEVLKQNNTDAAEEDIKSLESISSTSREVVQSMGDMVWSINPSRDNLKDTTQRMRQFAQEVFGAKEIAFTFDDDGANQRLDVDVRRQLYLVFKELVNNCAKYSECSNVEISVRSVKEYIEIRVNDDGVGFDVEHAKNGNGLKNLKMRAREYGGTFELDSKPGEGTKATVMILRKKQRKFL